MVWSVHQPWDPLKVCVVGKSYPPSFYEFITNTRLRDLFQKIAQETEEDYVYLENLLNSFGIKTIRPDCPDVQADEYLTSRRRIPAPISMNPRDQMIMIGDKFYFFPFNRIVNKIGGQRITDSEGQQELSDVTAKFPWWKNILTHITSQGNIIVDNIKETGLDLIPTNGIVRIGKDLYFGNFQRPQDKNAIEIIKKKYFSQYRCHDVNAQGHLDGHFCPVKPGLIVSIYDIKSYQDTFPGWEVVYLEGESWQKIQSFLKLKEKNQGRWWIKDHECDDELIDFVETWLTEWVGYVEETVFDVNILVIDQKNIIVNGYNKKAFDAFKRHGITAHIAPLRHRYFWDGGLHCSTLDLHRDGEMQDFFPERNN